MGERWLSLGGFVVVVWLAMVAAFTAVANADPSEKANLLSQSISVAMNTTACGLIAAIPLVLLHALVANSAKRIIDILDEQSAGMIAQRSEQ